MSESSPLRRCLREPILEIAEAAEYLNEAVSAHLKGRRDLADELIRRADMPATMRGPANCSFRAKSEETWGAIRSNATLFRIVS
jgi:hypothetical protein